MEWFSQQEGDALHCQGNETHSHFVLVLEEVLEILLAKAAIQQISKAEMNDLNDKVKSFVNSFDSLTVKDIDACSDDDSTSSQAPKRKCRPLPKVH